MSHNFHIPVLGICYSANTPILVGHLGITSVISLVDDLLLEKLRKFYCELYKLDYTPIKRNEEDGRSRRITAYLNMVNTIVNQNLEKIKKLPFFEKNEKTLYFELLPNSSDLKQAYNKLLEMLPGKAREDACEELTSKMKAGNIDVNIMVKVDRLPEGETDPNNSDAKAALRGFANSELSSSVVLSAGIHPNLYSYIGAFKDFYRDASGSLKKKIIIKISDFRSALTQEKFLAKKGLEVSEFRLESGLNCGGHAFDAGGRILPLLIKEFNDKRDQLRSNVLPMIQKVYEKLGIEYTAPENESIRLSVQGGVGTSGEHQRMIEEYNIQSVGWGSPFLLVPEATTIDDATVKLLADSTPDDLYPSLASPLGVLFNNIRNNTALQWMNKFFEKGTPGSPCANGFAKLNPEFGKPMCSASREYQVLKLEAIAKLPVEQQAKQLEDLRAKECICHQLGNSSLMKLGIMPNTNTPVAICPGPNIAWFKRTYSLTEMVDHIYGRIASLTPAERPHMFAQEIAINAKLLIKRIQDCETAKDAKDLLDYYNNLLEGMDLCEVIAQGKSFINENLESIKETVNKERLKLLAAKERLDTLLA